MGIGCRWTVTIGAGVLQDAAGNAYGGLSGSEYYFDVQAFVSTINKMNSGMGSTIGPKGGTQWISTTHGMAFLKTGGFISAVTRDNGIDMPGWAVPTDGGYSRIYMNTASWIATKDNGELSCWGSSSYYGGARCPDGQNSLYTPAGYPKPISYIYTGGGTLCALYTDTTVYCWSNSPRVSPPGTGWLTIQTTSTGSYCALNQDGSVFARSSTGVDLVTGDGAPPAGFFTVLVQAMNDRFIALSDDGSIAVFPIPPGPGPKDMPPGNGYTAIRPGYTSFSALKADGSVTCWGSTAGGYDFSTCCSNPAYYVGCPTDTGYVAITATGQNTAYAGLKADGTVSLWGNVHYSTNSGGTYPARYPALANVVKVHSNSAAFAALHEDGSITCWGSPEKGGARPLVSGSATAAGSGGCGGTGEGCGTILSSSECPAGTGFTQILASYNSFIAIASDGALFTWVNDCAVVD